MKCFTLLVLASKNARSDVYLLTWRRQLSNCGNRGFNSFSFYLNNFYSWVLTKTLMNRLKSFFGPRFKFDWILFFFFFFIIDFYSFHYKFLYSDSMSPMAVYSLQLSYKKRTFFFFFLCKLYINSIYLWGAPMYSFIINQKIKKSITQQHHANTIWIA